MFRKGLSSLAPSVLWRRRENPKNPHLLGQSRILHMPGGGIPAPGTRSLLPGHVQPPVPGLPLDLIPLQVGGAGAGLMPGTGMSLLGWAHSQPSLGTGGQTGEWESSQLPLGVPVTGSTRASCEHRANKGCSRADAEGRLGRNRMTEQYRRR